MNGEALVGKPSAAKPHAWLGEGKAAPAMPRRGSPLFRSVVFAGCAAVAFGVAGAACAESEAASLPWRVAPLYGGGYFQQVVISPSDPNVWYCYVDVGGPYRSDDAGANWRPLHSNFSAGDRHFNADHVRSLSVDPRACDSFVFCGGDNPATPAGIYVSRDGGRHVSRRKVAKFYGNGPDRSSGLVLARNPRNPDELVAASDVDGIFRTTDNGETWSAVGGRNARFTDIRYDRTRPNRIHASAPVVKGREGSGYWRSEDAGKSWARVSGDAPREMMQLPGRNEIVASFGRSVKVSEDGGESWKEYGEGLAPFKAGIVDYNNPGTFWAMATGPDFFLVGSCCGTIYKRRPGETQWQQVRRGKMTVDRESDFLAYATADGRMDALGSITVDEKNADHWLATDFYFIWESFDGGFSWRSRMKGIMPLVSFTVAFDPFDPNRICYGCADMRMFGSFDGGKTYFAASDRPSGGSVCFSTKTPHLAYGVGGQWNPPRFGMTRDGGANWEFPVKDGCGLPKLEIGKTAAYSVAVDPLNDDVYLAVSGPCRPGCGGVYRSHDRGTSWEWCAKGLPAGKDLFNGRPFGANRQLVFGTDGSLLSRPANDPACFRFDRESQVWSVAHAKRVALPVADPFAPGRFLALGDEAVESLDGGRTFRPCPSIRPMWSLAFDRHHEGLVVGMSGDGVYVSCDGAHTFEKVPDSLRVPSGARRDVFLDNGQIFHITTGSGLWSSRVPEKYMNKTKANAKKEK